MPINVPNPGLYQQQLSQHVVALRDALKARSSARFKFFDDQDRRKSWLAKLVTPGASAAPAQTKP